MTARVVGDRPRTVNDELLRFPFVIRRCRGHCCAPIGIAWSEVRVERVAEAVKVLERGGLVAVPTETVYGLAADASQPEAVLRIFLAKGRPADHPLIVHLPGASALSRWAAEVPPAAVALADAFWPGPLTMILPKADWVDPCVTGGRDSIGLRVPSHPMTLALLRAFDGGLAAPSANRFGHVSPTTAEHVREDLGDRVDLILDGGPCPVGIESTIIDLSEDVPAILRLGAVTRDDLSEVLGRDVRVALDGPVKAPGQLASHYAPCAEVEVVAVADAAARREELVAAGVGVALIGSRAG
ncbi:MAG: threonylcarbamoyl-AMP synthase, partial [Deltaproteobacteria bacterium]